MPDNHQPVYFVAIHHAGDHIAIHHHPALDIDWTDDWTDDLRPSTYNGLRHLPAVYRPDYDDCGLNDLIRAAVEYARAADEFEADPDDHDRAIAATLRGAAAITAVRDFGVARNQVSAT